MEAGARLSIVDSAAWVKRLGPLGVADWFSCASKEQAAGEGRGEIPRGARLLRSAAMQLIVNDHWQPRRGGCDFVQPRAGRSDGRM